MVIAKMTRLYESRKRKAFAKLYAHISCTNTRTYIHKSFYNDPHGAWTYIDAQCRTRVTNLEVRKLNRAWDDTNIRDDVGILKVGTLSSFVRLLQKMNSNRPANHKKDTDEIAEKLLECVAETSSKFSESAWKEYEAEPVIIWIIS